MGKKIVRGIGIAVCVLLFVSCVFMIVISAVFGAEGLVGAFGYNLYLCEESGFDGLNSGAAVVIEQCEPYDITEGNLVLYSAAGIDEEIIPALGYAESITMSDGVYTLELTDSEGELTTISESALVGRAGWSSDILGTVIRFSLSPWGVCLMAVLPCLALIVFTLVRGSERDELPEVVPQRKTADNAAPSQSGISVKPDGKAEYSRVSGAAGSKNADSVLFTYGAQGARRNPVSKPAPQQSRPAQPAQKSTDQLQELKRLAEQTSKKPSPAVMKKEEPLREQPAASKAPVTPKAPAGAVPSSVAAKRYVDNTVKPAEKSGATAEIPQLPKKQKSDAFFAQSSAPQIGRGLKNNSSARAVIDLEDALASTERRDVVPSAVGASKSSAGRAPSAGRSQTAGRRSSQILASKGREQLFTDEDDSRDRGRYDVDDILAGIDRKKS